MGSVKGALEVAVDDVAIAVGALYEVGVFGMTDNSVVDLEDEAACFPADVAMLALGNDVKFVLVDVDMLAADGEEVPAPDVVAVFALDDVAVGVNEKVMGVIFDLAIVCCCSTFHGFVSLTSS